MDRTFEKEIAPLQTQLGILQRSLWDRKVPIIIVVEGWNASGITRVITELIHYLDPRGFSMYSTGSPTDEERARPLLWRFWVKTPKKGRLAIFARSWYSRSLAEHIAAGLDHPGERLPHEDLSDREFQILRMLASGKTVTEIGNFQS
jgi:polyphosphate kinase 2 (PPK2 family)